MTRTLVDIIGPTIATDLTPSQETLVWDAIAENEPGVERCAQQVMANPNTRRPTPTFLSAIKRRQHLAETNQRTAAKLSLLDFAERRYHAKIAAFNQHGVLGENDDPDPRKWSQNDAIAYAVDYTIIDLKQGDPEELEDALRTRLGLPLATRMVVTPPNWNDVLKTLAAGKTQPRPASRSISAETADEILEALE